MAAGDLENIIPHPNATRTVNINFCDANGIMRSVKEVHYADEMGIDHLIWLRDHAPGGDDYTQPSSVINYPIFAKYVATSSSISKIKIWTSATPSQFDDSNRFVLVLDSQLARVSYSEQFAVSIDRDVISVDGTDTNVYTLEFILNSPISVTSGETYYVMLSNRYSYTYKPYFFKNTAGVFLTYTGYDWAISQLTDFTNDVSSHTTNLVKMEVNGVQV